MTTQQPTSSENDSTSSQPNNLAYSKQLEGTPFRINKTEQDTYFLTCGEYQLTTTFETPDEATDYINTNRWELILTLIHIVLHKNNLITNKN